MYKYKKSGGKYIVSLDNHVSLMEALTAFCRERVMLSASVMGIGAVSSATFRFLDPATKKYVDKTFDEQMELTSIVGNISRKDGEPYLHLHVTASRRDYTCVGGHLLSARVNGACELFVEDYGLDGIGRKFDSETGLNLYDF